MGAALVDAVVLGQRRQFEVGQAKVEDRGQLDRAQQILDGKCGGHPRPASAARNP